ncbi:M48 family metallopeptidase [Anaerotalea alkaliphila]|uniref:M48 family metallopeptidase n=1 Tax=Anaerotalea alkaliphila TaxID=2662126 RepID=A0A7X5HW58_9FIRM|nr:SprT family zinc-dependent metalloprotease [Anaerotalea alkaliphila]NDL67760.1 M48 family metallopeptidase [Anaerotalea alkaliphila]
MTLTYEGKEIGFSLTYRKRKTIGIHIDVYGHVEVRAPKGCPEAAILEVVENKAPWILEKVGEMKERTAGHRPKVYDHGERFLYLGADYPIQVLEEPEIPKNTVEFDGRTLHVRVREHRDEEVRGALLRFYRQRCKALVEERIREYQRHFQVKPTKIKICDSSSYWGTCNSKRELSFHWKLAMTPLAVVDAIVVHEMAHLHHMNHDRSFWRLVGKVLPDYGERKAWLDSSSWKMTI